MLGRSSVDDDPRLSVVTILENEVCSIVYCIFYCIFFVLKICGEMLLMLIDNVRLSGAVGNSLFRTRDYKIARLNIDGVRPDKRTKCYSIYLCMESYFQSK
jgi:hypothetical protein